MKTKWRKIQISSITVIMVTLPPSVKFLFQHQASPANSKWVQPSPAISRTNKKMLFCSLTTKILTTIGRYRSLRPKADSSLHHSQETPTVTDMYDTSKQISALPASLSMSVPIPFHTLLPRNQSDCGYLCIKQTSRKRGEGENEKNIWHFIKQWFVHLSRGLTMGKRIRWTQKSLKYKSHTQQICSGFRQVVSCYY